MLKLLHGKNSRKHTIDIEEEDELRKRNIPDPENRVHDLVSITNII